jgi:hypothetical protein
MHLRAIIDAQGVGHIVLLSLRVSLGQPDYRGAGEFASHASWRGARPFAQFHGAGNGLLTIAKGPLPLPIFGLLIDRLGVGALAISSV